MGRLDIGSSGRAWTTVGAERSDDSRRRQRRADAHARRQVSIDGVERAPLATHAVVSGGVSTR